MTKRVFVLVDFQNDFVRPDGKLTINSPELIERVQKFTDNLQKGMFDEIIITADNHFAETYHLTPEAKEYPEHCIHGTDGWRLAVDLKKNIPVNILYKSGNDLWKETPNYTLLQEGWDNTEVYMAGVLSDVCVRQAMEGFIRKGAKVTLLEDLCQGAKEQVPEMMAHPRYEKALGLGVLRRITSAQFFRTMLAEKKQKYNRVIGNREF